MNYEMVSGLETHVELATRSKIFCGCTTAFGGAPNTHCCPVCTGQPGALPVLNRRVVEFAIRAGLALNCRINLVTHLDRKNYCYPDLPKAYQISQYDKPLCEHGYIALDSGKRIGITRIHIEEDAGKLMHEGAKTFIDYNRGGVPLIEIVSEPDISSPEEAREYVEKLQLVMRCIGVSDCKMQEGSMRCDVNISVRREGTKELGTRTEIKNMNSISYMVQAMRYEFGRQCETVSEGGRVEQATLRFDERTGETYVMRSKEDAQDYRYFPEPDVYEIVIPESVVSRAAASLPELPDEKLKRYVEESKIPRATAALVCRYGRVCDFIDGAALLGAGVKNTVNLTVGVIFSVLSTEEERELFKIPVSCADMAELVKLVDGGKVNATLARSTLEKMLKSGLPVGEYIRAEDMAGVSDSELTEICRRVIEENPAITADFKGGKDKAICGFYGFIKRATGGRADMRRADEILRSLINKD